MTKEELAKRINYLTIKKIELDGIKTREDVLRLVPSDNSGSKERLEKYKAELEQVLKELNSLTGSGKKEGGL